MSSEGPEDGSWRGYLFRNTLYLVKLIERLAVIADAVCRCRRMGRPVEHDLRSETWVRWPGVDVTIFFRRIFHCSKEVEGRKEKGDHVSSLVCASSLCGRISDDAWRCIYAVIILKEARMCVPEGSQIGRSP